MSTGITFKQIKPTIIASLGLEGAEEWGSGYATEYEWNNHPDHPKTYLLWADFDPTEKGKDGIDGGYVLYKVKVLDTTRCEPRSERLLYSLGRVGIGKWYFDREYVSLDSKRFEFFKYANGFEETPFFRTRMEQLLSELNEV